MDTKKNRKNIYIKIFLIAAAIIIAVFELFQIRLSKDEIINEMLTMIITRGIGGIYVIVFIRYSGFKILNPIKKPLLKSLLVVLPCYLIVINNLPIIALLTKNAYVVKPAYNILLFALECLSVGLFEEGLFRGIIFLLILENCEKNTKGIFKSIIISSAIFGGIHIFNLMAGAGIGSVVLQVGYSFLLGCMCAAVLLKTKNIWICVSLHAIYNFCGLLLPTLGAGTWWDTPTIIITAILSVLVALYVIRMIIKIEPKSISELYNHNTE